MLNYFDKCLDRIRNVNPEPAVPQLHRVMAVELHAEGESRCVLAEIGGDRPVVLAARAFGAENIGELPAFAHGASAVLLANSERSICRRLDVPNTARVTVQQMIALRLEAELPYPVADSLWVYDQGPAVCANGKHVLVVAVPKADVEAARNTLHGLGAPCARVEYDASSLAELVDSNGPAELPRAVARIDGNRILLAITQEGAPRYVRRIRIGSPASARSEWVARVASEINQSMHEYQMRTGGKPPVCVLVAGEACGDEHLLAGLSAALGIEVHSAGVPESLNTAHASSSARLIEDYPACLGAVIALHRRARGERAMTPPLLCEAETSASSSLFERRVSLIVACGILCVMLAASAFAIRSARIAAADEALAELKPLSGALAQVQEEIDILQYESRRQWPAIDLLEALATSLPAEITVDTLTLSSDGKVSIKGKTKSVAAASETAIAALESSGLFAKCTFLGATEDKDKFAFQIACELGKTPRKAQP